MAGPRPEMVFPPYLMSIVRGLPRPPGSFMLSIRLADGKGSVHAHSLNIPVSPDVIRNAGALWENFLLKDYAERVAPAGVPVSQEDYAGIMNMAMAKRAIDVLSGLPVSTKFDWNNPDACAAFEFVSSLVWRQKTSAGIDLGTVENLFVFLRLTPEGLVVIAEAEHHVGHRESPTLH